MFMYVAWPRLTAEYRYVRILTGSDADKVFHLMQLWMSNDAAAGPVLAWLLEDSSDPVTRAAAARYLERYPSEPAIVGLMAAAIATNRSAPMPSRRSARLATAAA
jgi:hypothetical protein